MNVAEIWLWHVNTWRVAGRLQSHTLTVTQLEFSHDNRFLLSVSRDRHFSVFYLDKTGNCYSLFLCCSPYEQYLHIHTMHLYFKDRYTTNRGRGRGCGCGCYPPQSTTTIYFDLHLCRSLWLC